MIGGRGLLARVLGRGDGSRAGPTGRCARWLAAGILLLPCAPGAARETNRGSAAALHGQTDASLREVARQVHNPIGPLWQLTVDHAIAGWAEGGLRGVEPAYTGSFEPTIPFPLDGLGLGSFAWAAGHQLVSQLTVPFVETVPLPPGGGGGARSTGFGDIQLGAVLAPRTLSGWVWGLGPTFVFPSATDDALGQGKWQAGPAALAGYVGRSWTAFAIAQQWWSFAGDRDRPETSLLSLEYGLIRSLPGRWQIGLQPTMTVDWNASRGNAVSLPVGLGVGWTVRIGTIPVQLWLEVDYYAVRPDDVTGPRWALDLQLTPVIPVPF